jgi:hypothetical protein
LSVTKRHGVALAGASADPSLLSKDRA